MSVPPLSAGPSTRQWIILVILFLLSLPAVTPRIYSSDEIQYFAYLRSVWFDHDVSFENEYQYFYDRGIARAEGFHETFLEMRTETGRRINYGTIGCAMLWTPFYAAGDLVARATGAPRDGFSKPYIASVAYGSAVYGFLALVLAILCARRLGLNGFTGALAVWLGTPLLFYMYVAPPYSHACSAFGVALFTYVWLRTRDRWSTGGLLALGATGALMAMIREQDLFFAGGPALDYVLWVLAAVRHRPQSVEPDRLRQGDGESPTLRATSAARGLAAAAVGFAVVFAPQAATYVILNGRLGPHASVGNKMNWRGAHALEVLLSREHGFFIWTPLALLALAGLIWLTIGRPDVPPPFPPGADGGHETPDLARIGLCLLVMVALQIYIGGSVNSWTVAGAFGQRRFVALTTAMVIGYAALARRSASRVLAVVTIVAIYWNLALIAEFATGLMDRQRLAPAKNAYDAFVTLPVQAPTLAYRYLFDRGSFYKHGA